MNPTPLTYLDGETLMSTVLPPIRFVVDKLLPQGLHILAGAPKVGKSWLALWLCLCVAKGEPVWNFPTFRGMTTFRDTEYHQQEQNMECRREMLIRGKVFHVTSVFPAEAIATPTDKLLSLIDAEFADQGHSA